MLLQTLLLFRKALLVLSFGFILLPIQAQTVGEYYKKATNAYEAKDYNTFLKYLHSIDSLRPKHPTVYKMLAMGYAQIGNFSKAYPYLQTLAWINADTSVQSLPDFELIRKKRRFKKIMLEMTAQMQATQNSDTAFVLKEAGLHPEGLVYDSRGQSFFVGGIHQNKIIRIDERTGEASVFVENVPGLYAVTGLALLPKERQLWVCSNIMPEMEAYEAHKDDVGAIICLDLNTGNKIQSISLPQDSLKHLIGDITLNPHTGDLYMTDSFSPHIYRIKKGSNQLELWLKDARWENLQGLSFSEDGKYLFISDYRTGLYRIELGNKSISPLPYPKAFPKGVDGLYYHQQSLIAIHNGLRPFRITRYYLNKKLSKISKHELLENNHPALGEPTLGTIVNGYFYYIADSPWGGYKEGKMLPEAAQQPNHILRLKLHPYTLPF